MTTLNSSAESAKETEPTLPKSLRQPAWHVVLLSVFTLSLYLLYWYFKTARDLKNRAISVMGDGQTSTATEPALRRYLNSNPFWLTVALIAPTALAPLAALVLPADAMRAVGPALPFFTLAFFAVLFHDIAALSKDETLLKNNPSFPAFCLVIAMAMLWGLSKLPSVYYLLFTLVSIAPAISQHWLNDYWARVEPQNAHMRHSFTMGEIITLLVGSLPLTLIMLSP